MDFPQQSKSQGSFKVMWPVFLTVIALFSFQTKQVMAASSGPEGSRLRRLSFQTHAQVNGGFGLRIDVVFVYDSDLKKSIGGMGASEYYAAINQLEKDNKTKLRRFRFEMVPGQGLFNYEPVVKDLKKVWGVFIFSDYYNASGNGRIDVGADQRVVRVVFKEKETAVLDPEEEDFQEATQKMYPVCFRGMQEKQALFGEGLLLTFSGHMFV